MQVFESSRNGAVRISLKRQPILQLSLRWTFQVRVAERSEKLKVPFGHSATGALKLSPERAAVLVLAGMVNTFSILSPYSSCRALHSVAYGLGVNICTKEIE